MNRRYNIYATLLDAYGGYLRSSDLYHEFWGFSEDPPKTEEEFEAEQRQSLLNRINRIPLAWEESEAADRGTAFNEIVDCMILNKKSDKMQIDRIAHPEDNTLVTGLKATYNDRQFTFPIALCREFASYYKGATPQVCCEALLPTRFGDVLLYGYIDELMPFSVHDIKTTSRYKAGKYRRGWQHIVYPYCLNESGNSVSDFEYNIACITAGRAGIAYGTHTEHYTYLRERDLPLLHLHVEDLIEFLEANRSEITDRKIFNAHE
jgi:hypothetical protein